MSTPEEIALQARLQKVEDELTAAKRAADLYKISASTSKNELAAVVKENRVLADKVAEANETLNTTFQSQKGAREGQFSFGRGAEASASAAVNRETGARSKIIRPTRDDPLVERLDNMSLAEEEEEQVIAWQRIIEENEAKAQEEEDRIHAQNVRAAQSIKMAQMARASLAQFVQKKQLERGEIDVVELARQGQVLETFKNPTMDQVVAYERRNKLAEVGDARQFYNKVVTKIPRYSGVDSQLTWEAFMLHIKLHTQNVQMSEADIKQLLITSLDGAAFQYINANPELLELSYGQLIEKLEKQFSVQKKEVLVKLFAVNQEPKESVRDFVSRLKIAAKPLLRSEPPKIRVMTYKDTRRETLIPNPFYEMELMRYTEAKENMQEMLLFHLLRGIRRVIRATMPAVDYVSFDQAEAAALAAERTIEETGFTVQLNHLTLVDQEGIPGEVSNFMNAGQLKDLPNRSEGARPKSPGRAKSGNQNKGRDSSKVKCWDCGEEGHVRSKCPFSDDIKRAIEKLKSREGRNRSRSKDDKSKGKGKKDHKSRSRSSSKKSRASSASSHAASSDGEAVYLALKKAKKYLRRGRKGKQSKNE